MFALVDGNNFYVSCEQLFQPKLINQPVVVLSNNDGCVVSRSNEAKQMGIKMGEPLFKVKERLRGKKIYLKSSNYPLYADMSHRMMTILSDREADIEIYSIDEAFLYYPKALDWEQEGRTIKRIIQQWIGIPVGVGFGPTKTLAKAANYISKKTNAPCVILNENRDKCLSQMPVGTLWGVGRQHEKKCVQIGIQTALDFKNADQKKIHKLMHAPGEQIYLELNGIPCHDIQTEIIPPKSIVSSRSFRQETADSEELLAALLSNLDRGIEKLIDKTCHAGKLMVFIKTHAFKPNRHFSYRLIDLEQSGDGYQACVQHISDVLKKLIKPNCVYKKSGIMFCDLYPRQIKKQGLFQDETVMVEDEKITKTIYDLKKRWGKESVVFAQQLEKNKVQMNQSNRSSSFTTRLSDVLRVN